MNDTLRESLEKIIKIESPAKKRAEEFKGLSEGNSIVKHVQIAQCDRMNTNGRIYPKAAILSAYVDFVSNKKEGPVFEETENFWDEPYSSDKNLLGYFNNLEFDEKTSKLFCDIHLFKRPPQPYFTISGIGSMNFGNRVDKDYKIVALMNSKTTSWRFQEEERIKKLLRERNNAEKVISKIKAEAFKAMEAIDTEERKGKTRGLRSRLVATKALDPECFVETTDSEEIKEEDWDGSEEICAPADECPNPCDVEVSEKAD